MRECLEAAVDYADDHTPFGQPIASCQLVRHMIADISHEADSTRLFVWRSADLVEWRAARYGLEGNVRHVRGSAAGSEPGVRAFGGYGHAEDFPMRKYLRDGRMTTLYEGTRQIRTLLIGRAESGVNAYV